MGYLSSAEANDYELVKNLAQQAFNCPVSKIKPLPGYIAHNFVLNDKRIFKIASFRSSVDDWQKNVANAPIIQQYLSVQIPMPTLHTLHHGAKEIYALSYERLPGYSLNSRTFAHQTYSFKKNYISQLNDKMHELHQIPADRLVAPLPTAFEQATSMLFNSTKNQKNFTNLAKMIFPYAKENQTLVHADLHFDNVCFDGKKITGLLDFDSLCLGHPVFEFNPAFYRKKTDFQFALHDYMQRFPEECSPQIAKDFVRKYKIITTLFILASVFKFKSQWRTRFDELLRVYVRKNHRI